MEPKNVEKGTVIQVKQGASIPDMWHGCLLIVQHVAVWGIRAGMIFPTVPVVPSNDLLEGIPGVGKKTAEKIVEELSATLDDVQNVTYVRVPYPDFDVVGSCPAVPAEIWGEKWPVKP